MPLHVLNNPHAPKLATNIPTAADRRAPTFTADRPASAITATSVDRFRAITARHLDHIEPLRKLSTADRWAMRVVAAVLPFRVNPYVIDQLIDWDRVPDDPLFQLTFPQRGMLSDAHFNAVSHALERSAPKEHVAKLIHRIRMDLNPHPAGQLQHNIPTLNGKPLQGVQHKYPETVLFFPAAGQTCHSYCTFCFRWAQFVGDSDLKLAAKQATDLADYLRLHPEVSDILITGGDPMVMRTRVLARYLETLGSADLEHIRTIRFGSKALTFWPQRFTSDPDADDLLRLFEGLVKRGKHVAFMAHMNHYREMAPEVCREAIRRIRETGAVIRTQAPVMQHINDDPTIWEQMWRQQVSAGMVPYYMFVARDTSAQHYFEVPLVRAHQIFHQAMAHLSGLARTARGPSMSTGPGKIEVLGDSVIAGERVLSLRFIQARQRDWLHQPFFARYNDRATWLDQLSPAFGEKAFFFEEAYRQLCAHNDESAP